MKSEIICVGSEILMGEVLDTNSLVLARKLNQIGIDLYYMSVVGDNINRLKEQLKNAFLRSDIVIIAGGLGPTKDDITRKAVSEFLNLDLELNLSSKERIEGYFKNKNLLMPLNNIRQAYFPSGSKVFVNNIGTADGFLIEKDEKIIVVLPGPPIELTKMVDDYVLPYLSKISDGYFSTEFINIYGLSESQMEERILDLVNNQVNPTIGTYAKENKLQIRVTCKSDTKENSKKLLRPLRDEIVRRLGENFYGFGENLTLEDVVCKTLVDNNITISIAESCTAGLLAGTLVNYSGISKVFGEGYVTYSNDAKIKNLHVSEKTLEKYSAVSREVALEMAKGVRQSSKSDIGLSITGIAGPNSDDFNNEVGLIYIGYSDENIDDCIELHLSGDRQKIRQRAVLNALNFLRLKISK